MPHYIFNNILECEIIKLDTECFNFLQSNDIIKFDNIEFNKVIFIGTSYNSVNKIKYVRVSRHDVPINYIDFIPENKRKKIIYYNEIDVKFNKFSDLNLLKKISKDNIKYFIKNEFLIIESYNELYEKKILNYFSLIYKNIIKK